MKRNEDFIIRIDFEDSLKVIDALFDEIEEKEVSKIKKEEIKDLIIKWFIDEKILNDLQQKDIKLFRKNIKFNFRTNKIDKKNNILDGIEIYNKTKDKYNKKLFNCNDINVQKLIDYLNSSKNEIFTGDIDGNIFQNYGSKMTLCNQDVLKMSNSVSVSVIRADGAIEDFGTNTENGWSNKI